MSMKIDAFNKLTNNQNTVNSFAIAVLRDGLIENVLKEDAANIMYWAGKDLASQFFTKTLSGIETFFSTSGWGELEMTSQADNRQVWKMTGQTVADRFLSNDNPDFSLEAGYLAKQLENQLGTIAEATYTTNKKDTVNFTVITDPNTEARKIDNQTLDFREAILTGQEISLEPEVITEVMDDVPNFINDDDPFNSPSVNTNNQNNNLNSQSPFE